MPARPLKPIPVQPVWPRPASSVLVLAPMHSPQAAQPRAAQAQPQTDYSVLMLRRSSRGFFGGLSVFPGGVLEASDNLAVWRSKILPNYGGFTKSILKELEDDVLHDYEVLFARGDPESKKLDGEQRRDWGLGLLIAAIRETFEECGLALFKPHIDWLEGRKGTRTERKEVAEIWRKKVHDDAGMFVELCEKFRVAPDVGKLRFWSNWNTWVRTSRGCAEPRRACEARRGVFRVR